MPRSGPSVHRFAHEAMATVFEIFIAGKGKTYAHQAARAAFDEIDRLERLFSRFDPSSEISRASRLAPGERMRIGFETYECLTIAAEIRAATAGAFDVNFRALRGCAGPDPVRLSKIPGGFELARVSTTKRGPLLLLDIDLGAIGKGYALDSAAAVLRDWDAKNALLHAGTSTALGVGSGPRGRPGLPGWPVGVAGSYRCPGAPRTLRLLDRALSGSGTEVKGEHIFDPRTGRPARRHLAAWAAHPSAAVSDALSTAFFVMSAAEVRAFCAQRSGVWALVISGGKKCTILNSEAVSQGS